MADAEYQQLIEQYGALIERRDWMYRQYCALEIQAMEFGNKVAALSNGDYSAMNAEYEHRQPLTIVYTPTLPPDEQE